MTVLSRARFLRFPTFSAVKLLVQDDYAESRMLSARQSAVADRVMRAPVVAVLQINFRVLEASLAHQWVDWHIVLSCYSTAARPGAIGRYCVSVSVWHPSQLRSPPTEGLVTCSYRQRWPVVDLFIPGPARAVH